MNSPVARRRHPAALILLLFAALVAVGAVYAALSPSSARAAEDTAASQTQIEQGRTLYLEGCASCHGLSAEGTSTAPTLVGVGSAAVHFQVATGRMPMAQPSSQLGRKAPTYTEDQIMAMAAYVASLAPGPAMPTAEQLDTTEADLARGGELFRTNCAQCHNFAGSGAALTRGKYAPSLMDASPQVIYEAMLTGPQNMPVFGNGTLTSEDKRDVIKYIEHLQTQTQPGGWSLGSFGPVSEGAFVFTVGVAVMAAAAVWIGARAR